MKPSKTRLISFVGQKGGVGKSALARLLAIGAQRRGLRTMLADFDLEQLTCVHWNATRMRQGHEPELDVRSFKSLKKMLRAEDSFDVIVADTRGLADDLTTDVAKESHVVFLPTGTSADDLRPTLSLARKLARKGAEGRVTLILSKVGRSERQTANAVSLIEDEGFDLLGAHWPLREGFQAELDVGRTGQDSRNVHLRAMAQKVEDALLKRALRD